MRIAYLCNLYPAVSHSFVRREIEGIEQAGAQVYRFSLRPCRADLRDEADLREADCTEAALGKGFGPVAIAAIIMCVTRPIRSLIALAAAWRISGPGIKAKARYAAYWLEAAWLTRRLVQLRVEHLHAHFGTNPAAVALLVRAYGGPSFSFTVHGPDEFDAPIQLSLSRKIEAAAFVVAISSYARSQLMRWCKSENWPKIHVIRCGLDAQFLHGGCEAVRANSTELVCVARLSAQKGLPLLIAACDSLRGQGAQFSVTLIGDGELRDDLSKDIDRRGLNETITLAGVKTSSEIRAQLARARAFVLPSFAEGLPVVLMEALAIGRPAIATRICGIPELIDDSCGWLIRPGSEVALVDAMKAALDVSVEELTAMGTEGHQRVLLMHDAAQNAAALLEFMRSAHASPYERGH